MPTLIITEFSDLQATRFVAAMNAAVLPALGRQAVAIGATSVASASVGATTVLVRLQADANCSFIAGATPVATSTSDPLTAGAAEYFQVTPGLKIAVIARA